ncbi:MAG: bifunctional 5,10-methylenetetrahydrofolate dehydrogenase/5,10-methenyltetrahydrofolate cyclohydrolase [Sphaerochaeta sp.]|nr:bifunctional 5,10-methylenetetrahydrofolate dehydrogenase/5,10-methenyltetrahydrofolate cyclohydrolase [Sphaerochaeta sp.]
MERRKYAMQVLRGKPVAEQTYVELRQRCAQFVEEYGYAPSLAVVLVGSDPASQSYVASKQKACEDLGFSHVDHYYDEDVAQDDLIACITALNEDPSVHGILVQLPLPPHIDESSIIETISVEKDVDGFHPQSVGNLLIGRPCFVSCTPLGILRLLDYYHIDVSGKHVVIVGRSNIVGKPMASLLIQKGRDATVTLCHSKTSDLASITGQADILIAAIGRANFITASMVRQGCVVIDVGINRVDDASRVRGYRLVGDVDYESVAPKSSAITPVPGGVGVMTIAMLMYNTMRAAEHLAAKGQR